MSRLVRSLVKIEGLRSSAVKKVSGSIKGFVKVAAGVSQARSTSCSRRKESLITVPISRCIGVGTPAIPQRILRPSTFLDVLPPIVAVQHPERG